MNNAIFQFLVFCQQYILVYNLPTNPVTGVLYLGITYYGYIKLKTRVDLNFKRVSNRLLIFLYSLCILGFINFMLENVWLTCFFIRYNFFNIGWLPQIYFDVPNGWFLNYLRNFVFLFVCYYVSRDVWQHVNFNKKTLIGFLSVSLYISLFFFLSPHYGYIDWTYGIHFDFPIQTVLNAFIICIAGKPLLFYTFYTIWQPKTHQYISIKQHGLILDVGCGSRPQGNVNVDILDKETDPLLYNIQQQKNFKKSNINKLNFIVADARFLPFKNKIFQKTFCFHVVEHIREDQKVYREIDRVTKKEIEVRVPFGIWEDIFNTVFWWKHLKAWRKKHHLRSYFKKPFEKSLQHIFPKKHVYVTYGYLSFVKALKFKLQRKTFFPFPFPFELIARIQS